MDRNHSAPDSPPLTDSGDSGAAESLFPLLYEELRRIAHRQLAVEREGHTLCTTALVHEAYVKLADQTRAQFASRAAESSSSELDRSPASRIDVTSAITSGSPPHSRWRNAARSA